MQEETSRAVDAGDIESLDIPELKEAAEKVENLLKQCYTVSMNNNEVKKGISEEEIAATIKELCHLIKKSDDEAFIYEFFNCLFTKPELKDIANRWLLVKEIDAGTTQREIANKFSMSLCKITRGSRELNKEDSAFRKMLELLKNQ